MAFYERGSSEGYDWILEIAITLAQQIHKGADRRLRCEPARLRFFIMSAAEADAGINVGDGFDREERIDQFPRDVHSEHGRDQVARFLDDLDSWHRVAHGSSDGLDAIGELRSVSERDLHDRDARRQQRGHVGSGT